MSFEPTLNKVLFFSATQKERAEDTILYKSIEDWNLKDDIDAIFSLENKEPLPVVYNQAIKAALEGDYDALVLVHDDVILEHNPIPKLEKLFQHYGLVGVAGTSKLTLGSPALWHLMGGGFQGGNLHGAVAHGNQFEKHMTSFGKYPHRVLMIDGVFMALEKETFRAVWFDESNPAGFHFYDLDYSYNCAINGIRVGVGDIAITHSSPGLREFTDEWKAGEAWFLNKYAK